VKCDTAIVFITIVPVNDPPVAVMDNATTSEDSSVAISILNNDTDADGGIDTSSLTITDQPNHGTVIVNGNGTLSYTPSPNYNGNDTLIYQVCDNGTPLPAQCDTAVVLIFITPVNDPPVVPDTIVTVPEDSLIIVCVPITDPDLSDSWTVSLCGGPLNGTLISGPLVSGNNVCLTYAPVASWVGTDSVCLVTCDAANACDTSKVKLIVTCITRRLATDTSICQGDSVIVGTHVYSASGTYIDTLIASTTCDSIITTNLTVRPVTSQTIDSSICQGDSVTVGGQTFNSTGTFTVVIPNAQSCDSTITLNLTVIPTTSQTIDSSICQGDSVTVGGQTFNTTGTFTVVIPNAQSCDSTITLNLVVRLITASTINSNICRGDSVTVGGQVFSIEGTYTVIIMNVQGCDSIITLNLTLNNCNAIDTIREIRSVQTTTLICTITKPATGAASITSCDGSTAGTTDLGSWSIIDSCLSYTAGNIKGLDSLCIEACDGQPIPICTRTIVIISVVGLPPKAVDDAVITMPNTPVVIHILDNDTTFDTDPLALCTGGIVSVPSNGSTVINADGTITYTPSSGYSGMDSFQYQVCDPDGSDTGWVFVHVAGCEIPNAISPNGDGINDAFVIPCSVNPPDLNIFNRWGIEVYRNEHYMNDWNGEYQNLPLPDGTYYYIVKFESTQGTTVQQAGFITIHR
jgi:gliding motility-associated-like protein